MPGLADWMTEDTSKDNWSVLYPFNRCTARDWGSLNDKQLLQGRWVPLRPPPSPWSVTEQQFARLSNTDRFVYVVGVAARRLPRDAGAALLELVEPRNIAIMSGMLAFIVGAHFIGVGVFVDIALVGATAVVLGKEGVEGLVRLKSAIEETLRADCYLALDSAGLTLSEAALKLSVATLTAILLKRAMVQPRYSGPVAPKWTQGGPVNGSRPVPSSTPSKRAAMAGTENRGAVSETVEAARARQAAMLKDDVGFNISPLAWDQYPTIGRSGTFVSDRKAVMSYFGNIAGKTEITIPRATAAQIEKDMGLVPGSLQDGFKVRQITGLKGAQAMSPLEGNQYFLGPGNHLPSGAPEMVIRSIPTVDNSAVTTILKVKVSN